MAESRMTKNKGKGKRNSKGKAKHEAKYKGKKKNKKQDTKKKVVKAWYMRPRYAVSSVESDIEDAAVATTDGPRPPPFRFLDLPQEIQNRIYKHILLEDEPIFVLIYCRGVQQCGHFWRNSPIKLPALLLACKKFHEEATGMYYSGNVFDFTDQETYYPPFNVHNIEKFRTNIHKEALRFIKTVRLVVRFAQSCCFGSHYWGERISPDSWRSMNVPITITVADDAASIVVSSEVLLTGKAQSRVRRRLGFVRREKYSGINLLGYVAIAIEAQRYTVIDNRKEYPLELLPGTEEAYPNGKHIINL
ncbi:hypothetical protein EJ08DRAFT_655611 [Tothia fuscella]|uniref:2EXR domain-containing protein n=1 Tax=Tothia fuscella TaxID=1048955 RepID=A0A9P4U4G5_9PEZI|nr:hypothetical protein EJ08DRAFT_655611 [Tothia fuscella]